MRVFCSICKELFVPFSDVKATNCGHLYHSSCIGIWINRSKSCPQCRAHIRDQPFRVYFDVEQGEGVDASTLEHQLETLNDKLRESERVQKSLKETNENLEEVLGSMKEYSKQLESKNEMFKSSLSALKEKFSKELKKNKKLETDLESYMSKAKALEGLEIILNGSAEDVNNMLKNVPVTDQSVKQLCTYVQVLKDVNHAWEEKSLKLLKEKDRMSKLLDEEKKRCFEEAKKLYETHAENSLKTIENLTKMLHEYRRKVHDVEEIKVKKPVPIKPSQKKNDSKKVLEDLTFEENVPSVKEIQAKKIDVINNWEDIVCAGPSKSYKRAQSFGTAQTSNKELTRSSSYAFDGMGGSKKIRMSLALEKKQEKNCHLKDQNKIYSYFLNNDSNNHLQKKPL